jgi:hypothetical protein
MALETEDKTFEAQRPSLLVNHQGQFPTIKGEHVLGTFTTFAEAFEAGVRAYGTSTFMVKQIAETDEQVLLPALNAGPISFR